MLKKAIVTVALIAAAVFSTFWFAAVYATQIGRDRAQSDDRSPTSLTRVVVLSDQSIDIPGGAVQSVVMTDQESNRKYRYTGLRLLSYSQGRYFLLVGRVDENHASTVAVVRDTELLSVQLADPQ